MGRKVDRGRFYPLGATREEGGVNFALYSKHASEVFLLLFDTADGEATDVIRLASRTRFVFHAFVHGVKPGQLYGYKVKGPFDPARGYRFNEHKLLVDPYARALSGKPQNVDNVLLAYDPSSGARDLSLDTRDSSRWVPKGIVIDERFDWQGDKGPLVPLEEMVIYEVHLKGFTAHPSSKVKEPGTYLGFIEKIPHLVELGINAVELLPIQERMTSASLTARGLTNYWGYDTLGFFAPESTYRASKELGAEVAEVKTLVRALHAAGIEVILDVVYNHTAESNEMGPTVSFRGIDNPTYYVLTGPPDEPQRQYENWSGCGNSLNVADAHVIRFIMDSLRYWVEEMHVDGFRFDLASVLGREGGRFERAASFFDTISQDPLLSRVKLIAEPWDLGAYEVGNFPVDWSEWNGRFRDNIRRFERGDAGQLKELGYRLSGSSDLYADDGRSAYNTVNFVTCHDGFTLHDLVSYERKHNEANGEDNRDGTNDNYSWNCGAEGETDDPAIARLRRQRAKNLIVDLFFAAGTPMLLGGDEMLRTQRGTNNAYCHDDELTWFDWTRLDENRDIFDFTKRAIAFAKLYPVLRRRTFCSGRDSNEDDRPDIRWYGPNLDHPSWSDGEARTIAYQLDGNEAD
ncbi:MAG TPA: glycogen debranching protein GlgX, partial [Labilithrix sp.]|nr:glycogen debranching protein GlgX [Labilithrix sp.]